MTRYLLILLLWASALSAQFTTLPGGSSGGAPASHASQHQNGGSDEVATATPGANALVKAEADGDINVGWIPLDAAYTWTGNHQFTPTSAVTGSLPTAGNFDAGWRLRPTPITPAGTRYAGLVVGVDVDDGALNKNHYGIVSDVRGGTTGTSGGVVGFWSNVANEVSGSSIVVNAANFYSDNNQADDTLHAFKITGGTYLCDGTNKCSSAMNTFLGNSSWLEGIHLNGWNKYGLHVTPTSGSNASGDADIYLESGSLLLGVSTNTTTPPANKLNVYAKTGTPETLCAKNEDGIENCLGTAVTTTRRTSMVRFISFDGTGNGAADKLSNYATNDISLSFAAVFLEAGSIQIPMHGRIEVPEWCDSNPSIFIQWATTATTGNVAWDLSYYVVSGNDSESIDPAAWDEENIQCSAADCVDAAGSAALERMEFEITPVTAANITGKGTIFWELSRDMSDVDDTLNAAALVLDVMLECDGS